MVIAQKAVIKRGDKYLVLLRSLIKDFFPLHWDFSGGKLEPGETLEAGIVREVKEETNLDIKPIKIISEFEYGLDANGQKKYHFNIYSVEVLSDNIKLSEEHADFRWATKEEILSLPRTPYFEAFFKDNP